MFSQKTTQEIMSWILTAGMLLSLACMLIGGSLFLWEFGHEKLTADFLAQSAHYNTLSAIWQALTAFSAFGIIQFGVILLVATQVARIILLIWFYTTIRDYWFTGISAFVLFVILYSFFKH